jgi:phosphoribosylformimino-5-aminoimidazole carboxamide ribotide isomerase
LAIEACRKFPGRIAIKIDSQAGLVAVTGWLKTSSVKALDLALRFEESGAAAIIYADINRDGALSEINREAIIDLAYALTTPVIASGGVNSLGDIAALKSNARAGVAGLILGRALTSGKIKADEALALADG